jgi:hypothetical protein
VVAAVFAAIVSLGIATPGNLLLFTFVICAGLAVDCSTTCPQARTATGCSRQ